MSSSSANPNMYPYQNEPTWSKSEKAIARTAFDVALERELQDIMQKAKQMACQIKHKGVERLSPKEVGFVEDMVRWCARREPTEKQAKWLHVLYCKIGRRP